MTASELPSWNAGPAKRAVLDFVATATTPGAGFIDVADRIAAFDNDGTLWSEQPLPPQFDFVFRRWGKEVAADPLLASIQPYKALAEKDMSFFARVAAQDPETITPLLEAFGRSWAGTTPQDFDAEVRVWLETVKQPKFDVPYIDLVYRPMLELIEYLKANDFRVFVCSGGGRDFMRTFAEETWGIYKENVIGSAADYRYVDGQIVRTESGLGGLDIGPGKPEHIFAQTGRLPVFAGGNADVDIEMLESARFALLLNHDDGQREFAYSTGAERAVARAAALDWTVVSMRNDWNTVFGTVERVR
ncbi:HAD family hydrolase [Cryobacterium arcticum]|uniref:Haloacid dehalogenase-like hydrolase n=1 Tax=Cryobacterium arcticum TaxID=670052 RepID=A0A318A407_9MICO|nr:HAD family hydrolase [Cryobacterium arcticum]PXA72087.1 haloacid dehalogenase-like hydrolase [Cryobacterium arcticum]